jgi:hypothetical protein
LGGRTRIWEQKDPAGHVIIKNFFRRTVLIRGLFESQHGGICPELTGFPLPFFHIGRTPSPIETKGIEQIDPKRTQIYNVVTKNAFRIRLFSLGQSDQNGLNCGQENCPLLAELKSDQNFSFPQLRPASATILVAWTKRLRL